ncbi:unnamed protein product [Chironomus riparius]|uniref:Receptor ligand binding region domain-containing protein n=1 Tax=Chironomus riparius TaxID=315576 RepID=A0A9N9RLI8_9DIPT|nr:unnamed protein product [Chironomus riparius]
MQSEHKISHPHPKNPVKTKMLHMGKGRLLRLQQIYQGLNPGNETFQVEIVKRINNVTDAIEFLQKIEQLNRWSRKFVVLDCPTDMAKDIVKTHVRDVTLGKRTYHYLLSGLKNQKNLSVACFCFRGS